MTIIVYCLNLAGWERTRYHLARLCWLLTGRDNYGLLVA